MRERSPGPGRQVELEMVREGHKGGPQNRYMLWSDLPIGKMVFGEPRLVSAGSFSLNFRGWAELAGWRATASAKCLSNIKSLL